MTQHQFSSTGQVNGWGAPVQPTSSPNALSRPTLKDDLLPEKVTPHMLRHSKAMHLLENGVNLVYIRDILDHASIVTTEVYAKANPEMKRQAIEAAAAKTTGPSRYDNATAQDLLAWLRQAF